MSGCRSLFIAIALGNHANERAFLFIRLPKTLTRIRGAKKDPPPQAFPGGFGDDINSTKKIGDAIRRDLIAGKTGTKTQ